MLFALLIAAAGAASAVPVVFEGAQTEIVISPRQAVATEYAAKEMKALLGQVLDADIPFVNRPTPGKRGIYVGPGEWSERLGIVTNGLARDEFRIVVRPEGAYIVGRDDPKKNPWILDVYNYGRWAWPVKGE